MKVNALDAVADACQHLVWDGVDGIAEHRHGQMVAENLHGIALAAINSCYIYHRHIHADIADVGCRLAIHQAIAFATPEMAVQHLEMVRATVSSFGTLRN